MFIQKINVEKSSHKRIPRKVCVNIFKNLLKYTTERNNNQKALSNKKFFNNKNQLI